MPLSKSRLRPKSKLGSGRGRLGKTSGGSKLSGTSLLKKGGKSKLGMGSRLGGGSKLGGSRLGKGLGGKLKLKGKPSKLGNAVLHCSRTSNWLHLHVVLE